MQRGGRAARRLREFGDMDLDTTVQEVEAESKHTVDGDLPYPWDMQRDEDEPHCGKCAAGDHQMALAHMGDEGRNRERIETPPIANAAISSPAIDACVSPMARSSS